MALAARYNMVVKQLDVVSAFLQSELQEQVYMKVPEGINYTGDEVCLLLKSVYGLKQSPRAWNRKLHNFLTSLGFQQSKTDYCTYYMHSNNVETNIYILIFVDDVLLITRDTYRLKLLKEKLKANFEITNAEPLSYFLGIRVDRDDDNIYLSQKAYLENLLCKSNMADCKPISTPLEVKVEIDELTSASVKKNIRAIT